MVPQFIATKKTKNNNNTRKEDTWLQTRQGHVAMLGVPGFADEKFREVSITRVHGRSIDINRVELEASPVHSFTHKHIGQAHNLYSTSYIQV